MKITALNSDEQLIRKAKEKYPKGTIVEALFLDGSFVSSGYFETYSGDVWTKNDIGKPVRVYRCDTLKWAELYNKITITQKYSAPLLH